MGYLPTAEQIAELQAAYDAAEAAKQALAVAIYGAYSPNPHLLHAEDEEGTEVNIPVSEYSAGLLVHDTLGDWQDALGISALYGANIDALDGLIGAADKLAYFTGAGAMDLADLTSVGRGVLSQASKADVRTYLEIGAGSGDLVGPGSATDGTIPLYDGATGKLLKGSAYTPASFFPAGSVSALGSSLLAETTATGMKGVLEISLVGSGDVVGPTGATEHNIPIFSSGTGKAIEDSGVSLDDFVQAGGALAAGKVLLTDGNGDLTTTNSVDSSQLAYLVGLTGVQTIKELLDLKMDIGGSIDNADTLDTYHAKTTYQSAQTAYIPVVNTDGTIELGRYIDLHVAGSTADYDARMEAISGGFQFHTDTTWTNGENLIFGTSTGTKIGTSTSQKIGFWNATPVARPGSITQTYSTEYGTVPAMTLTANISYIPLDINFNFTDANSNFSNITSSINKLRVDTLYVKQNLNYLINLLQTMGLVG